MSDSTQPRAKPGAVLAIGAGLAAILGAALGLLREPTQPVDGRALLEERFTVTGLPFGYDVDLALRMPGGIELVVLADPDAVDQELAPIEEEIEDESEPEPEAEPEPESGGGGSRWERKEFDWTVLEQGEPGTVPSEVAIAWYPREDADAFLRRQFVELRFRDLAHLDWDGEAAPVDSGHLDWFGFDANFVRIRHFDRKDGKPVFHDTVRINLTLEADACVLYLRWPKGMPGSRERAEEVLGLFAPSGG